MGGVTDALFQQEKHRPNPVLHVSGSDAGRWRVLHAPVEIAGQAAMSSLGLRTRGIESHVLAPRHPFGYESPDIVPPSGRWARARTFLAAARTHDVFHFYFGLSFLQPGFRLVDAWALRRLGKRVVVEFLGSDARMPSIEARRNPYYVRSQGEDDQQAVVRMRRWAQITDGHVIVGDHQLDPFLLPHFPHVHYVGQRVDTRRLKPRPPQRDAPQPIVVHAPSHLAVKGTVHVRRAIAELRAAGVPLEYVEVHGASHEEVLRQCERADLVVDQLCSGAHGVFAAEAMSLAKPVICNMLPEHEATLPGCPIINANPESITEVLSAWLDGTRDRYERGLASRSYAEVSYDVRVVADRLVEIYETLPGR
jgi:glycosyltransferase involved in cell wall biosynthesis